jgi:hypothetical protein
MINDASPPCLVSCKPLTRPYGRGRVASVPNFVELEERIMLKRIVGWLVVNPLGVTEPKVGWKQEPFPAVASHYLFLISVFILYVLNWELMVACMYSHLYKYFSSLK